MARGKSPAQAKFDAIVKRSITHVLQPLGFRKSSSEFHRRHNDAVQVVSLESSRASTQAERLFYVNVGLAFDAICQLTDTEIIEKPKEHDCDSRGTRDRLENLVDNVPDRWSIRSDSDLESQARQLRDAVEQLAVELHRIDGIQAYRGHRWFDRFRPKQENAQILYLLGDLDGAWSEVENLCRLFADRDAINKPVWWIQELRLANLEPRCGRPNTA